MASQECKEMVLKMTTVLKLDSAFSKCSRKKNVEGIFSYIWDLDVAHQILTPTLITSRKSEVAANDLRNKGNAHYKRKEFKKALELYNRSIMAAPHPVLKGIHFEATDTKDDFVPPVINPAKYGGTTDEQSKALAMGYANRSAVMFELNFHDKCLRDINLALEYGYPKEKLEKLNTRKQKCIAAQSNSDTSVKDVSISTLFQQLMAEQSLESLLSYSEIKAMKLSDPNPAFPSLSSAIKVASIPSKGRGWVAVRDIRPGEVLCVERAYCVSLEEDKLSTYCSCCLEFCLTPLPCPGCSKVIFCSKTCQTKGLAEDHWMDCNILPTLIAINAPFTNSSYKLLKTLSYMKLRAILNKCQPEVYEYPEKMGCNVQGIYDSASYQTIHYLSENEKEQDTNFLIQQSLYAFILTKLLYLGQRYFVDDFGEPFSPTREDFVSTGVVLLSYAMKLQCNSHSIRNVQLEESVASGLFPTASLVNHSCIRAAQHVFFWSKNHRPCFETHQSW